MRIKLKVARGHDSGHKTVDGVDAVPSVTEYDGHKPLMPLGGTADKAACTRVAHVVVWQIIPPVLMYPEVGAFDRIIEIALEGFVRIAIPVDLARLPQRVVGVIPAA